MIVIGLIIFAYVVIGLWMIISDNKSGGNILEEDIKREKKWKKYDHLDK